MDLFSKPKYVTESMIPDTPPSPETCSEQKVQELALPPSALEMSSIYAPNGLRLTCKPTLHREERLPRRQRGRKVEPIFQIPDTPPSESDEEVRGEQHCRRLL